MKLNAKLKIALSLILLTQIASAQTCPQRLQLRPVPAASRGGTIIWKSNWNVKENRENTPQEGNHSAKGGALLVHYKAKKYISTKNYLEVRDNDCRIVGRMGRFPRCTSSCGEYERWYLRSPGGSYFAVEELAKKSGGSVLIRLKGRQWAQVSNVFSEREIYP